MIVRADQGCEKADTSFFPLDSDISPFALLTKDEHCARYGVRYNLDPCDEVRNSEYQRLRTETFVRQLGWDIPVDEFGRERDRYDQVVGNAVNVHCVYGIANTGVEHLLAGVRVFQLRDWRDSMVTNEFYAAGMIPIHVLHFLRDTYNCTDLLEITRFCVQHGRRFNVAGVPGGFNNQIARDLAYAAVFAQAQDSRRGYALGLSDEHYLRVMKRSHFLFQEIYQGQGVTLIVIDLWGTIRSMIEAGDLARVYRMLALCP